MNRTRDFRITQINILHIHERSMQNHSGARLVYDLFIKYDHYLHADSCGNTLCFEFGRLEIFFSRVNLDNNAKH